MSDATFVIDTLAPQVTVRRLERMQAVLAARTARITVVVEDIYQSHNASAVLRSCDAFGVQHVHIIENRNLWRPDPAVELGTAQWLTLHRYTSPDARRATGPPAPTAVPRGEPVQTARCLAHLRERGYRIIATSPHGEATTPARLDLDHGPVALLFGTEKEGLTPQAVEAADELLTIPMVGFVESLNISVSAAVTLAALTDRLRRNSEIDWRLSQTEQDELLADWLRGSVRSSDAILARARSQRDAG